MFKACPSQRFATSLMTQPTEYRRIARTGEQTPEINNLSTRLKTKVASMKEPNSSKRNFIKTAAYAAPAIMTLKVMPTFASTGSGRNNNGGGQDPQPSNNPPNNGEAA